MTNRGAPVVAMVTDSVFPFFRGGKEIRYHEIIRRLSRDAEVRVYTMKWWEGPRSTVIDGVEYRAVCPRVGLYSGGRRSLAEALVFGLASARLAVEDFDAIEADHIPYTPLFVLRAVCTMRRKRLVVTWHEVWGRELWREYLGALGTVAWWIERAAMLLPDVVIAASPETASRLQPYVRARAVVEVAPNGLDLDQLAAAQPDPCRTDLAFVGRLLEHKHVDQVVAVVARLRAGGMPVRCRVIGRGPELERLRAQAREEGVDDLVEFRDDVDDQASMYALLKAADVFVFPSVREGFGISVLEALACGLPVVTTSAPDNHAQALVRRTGRGIVCEPTVEALTDAVRTLLESRGSEAGSAVLQGELREFIGQYDWERVVDVVASALEVTRG